MSDGWQIHAPVICQAYGGPSGCRMGDIRTPDGVLIHVPVIWSAADSVVICQDYPRCQTRSLYWRAVLMDEKKPDLAMLIRDILYQESLSSYAWKAASFAWT